MLLKALLWRASMPTEMPHQEPLWEVPNFDSPQTWSLLVFLFLFMQHKLINFMRLDLNMTAWFTRISLLKSFVRYISYCLTFSVTTDDYFLSRLPVVEKRLAQGGVRLAAILNRIFAVARPLISQEWRLRKNGKQETGRNYTEWT